MLFTHMTVHAIFLQLSEYQESLSEAQSQLCQMKSQLTSLEQSKAKLQQVLDARSGEERQREAQIKLLEAKVSDKAEQLANAEDKIQVQLHLRWNP